MVSNVRRSMRKDCDGAGEQRRAQPGGQRTGGEVSIPHQMHALATRDEHPIRHDTYGQAQHRAEARQMPRRTKDGATVRAMHTAQRTTSDESSKGKRSRDQGASAESERTSRSERTAPQRKWRSTDSCINSQGRYDTAEYSGNHGRKAAAETPPTWAERTQGPLHKYPRPNRRERAARHNEAALRTR